MNLDNLVNKKKWLAPLAGFTDRAFRIICKKNGADVLVSEMVSVDGLVYASEKTKKLMYFSEVEKPYGIQLFGSDPDIFVKATKIALELNPDFIDINMGCPVKKVVKRNAGSALMKNPDLAARIVEKTKETIPNLPLSVKIRAGWTLETVNSLSFSKKMQNAGADMLVIHPRTRTQFFSGHSNWNLIKEIKEHLKIPVIGNGDIQNMNQIDEMYKTTKCDSVMIGRGALGNPWIFEANSSYDKMELSQEMMLDTILFHYENIVKFKGESIGIKEMRKHLAYYTKGLKGGAQLRNFINSAENLDNICSELKGFFQNER